MRLVRREDVREPFHGEFGELIYEMTGRPEHLGGSSKHSFVHVVVPPGDASPAHYHKESEETYYGIAGRGVMQVGNRRFYLVPGLAVLIMPGEVHRIRNAERAGNLEFLTISAPAWVPDDSFPAELPAVEEDLTR